MRETQSFHMYIRGLLLIGFGMLLFKLLVTGNIENFLAPKMEKFMIGTFLIVITLGIAQVMRSGKEEDGACSCCEHSHHLPRRKITSLLLYSLFLIPIVTAFLFSDHIIDGSVAAKRGVSLTGEQLKAQQTATSSSSQLSVETQTAQPSTIQQPPKGYYEKLGKELMNMQTITVDDTRFISILDVIGRNVSGFKGKQIVFTGFVDREPDFKKDQVVVARYGITCCVADASVLGMMINGSSVSSLKAGEWVKVTGVLDQTTYIDTILPIIKVTAIEKTAPSKEQYVYQKF